MPTVRPEALVADVRVMAPKGLNTSIYLDLDHFARATTWAHGFMHAYALWLGPALLSAVFATAYAVLWWRRAPRAAALLILGGIGTLVALGLNQLVGHAARELRPYATHPHALVLVARANDYSFPSDHAVIAGGLTASVLLTLGHEAWRRRNDQPREAVPPPPSERWAPGDREAFAAAIVILGLFLCFARVYVGAHYPGDVVAGYLLGAVVVSAVSLLRPLAYRVVALTQPTTTAALLCRPETVPATGARLPGWLLRTSAAGERQRRAPQGDALRTPQAP